MGFIGSFFIRNHLHKNSNDKIINLDSLTTGSNKDNLKIIENKENYSFVKGDIRNSDKVRDLIKQVDVVINFAAETHVDRSISTAKPFVETNVLGTLSLLDAIREFDKFFIQVSTDEVYGEALGTQSFTEKDTLYPNNPYSATKAAADHLVQAYHKTYGIKSIITRCTNNFGTHQFPEKFIPKTIIRAINNLKVPIYGDGEQIRSWISVYDHVNAIESLIQNGISGQIYNIADGNEITNMTLVKKILDLMDKTKDLIEYVEDRPGHDRRYSIDSSKITSEIGWMPKLRFEEALQETVNWYLENQNWWKPIADKLTLNPQPWTLKKIK